jgi:hypothetical protein
VAGVLARPLGGLGELAAGDPPAPLDHLTKADQRTFFVYRRDPPVRACRSGQKANRVRAHVDDSDPHNSIVLPASDITCSI